MKIGFRVNPGDASRIEFMDSKNPQTYSLKYRNFVHLLHLPEYVLIRIKGAYSEVLLEKVRAAHYSDRPSRLRAVFVFEKLGEAKWFRTSGWMEPDGLIMAYSVEELYSQPFVADMCLTNMLGKLREKWEEFKDKKAVFIKPTVEESLEFICHAYWQGKTAMDLGLGDENHICEVLLDGSLQLLPFVPLGK